MNRFEEITDKAEERIRNLTDRIAKTYTADKPYASPKVEPIDKVYIFDKLTNEDKMSLVQKHGMDAWNKYMKDVQKIKKMRGII